MNLFKKTIVVRKAEELDERELNLACAMGETSQAFLWKAVHQLIDTLEENAIADAAANMDPPGLLAGYVGGAAQVRLLREDLYRRQALGKIERGEKGDVKSQWLRKQVEPPTL
jgi:predicted DNA-binding protein